MPSNGCKAGKTRCSLATQHNACPAQVGNPAVVWAKLAMVILCQHTLPQQAIQPGEPGGEDEAQ